MQFNDVIGQRSAVTLLRKIVDTGRVPHALMLLGVDGSGDLGLAWAFVQYLLCENRKDGDSCGACSSCTKVSKLVHPDLHFSFPTVGSQVTSDVFLDVWRKALLENPYISINEWLQRMDAENRQGNITTAECNQIIRKLSLKIFEGRKKVLVMWLPEYLGKEGNRLLKLIEEPPDHTVMIFVAHDQEQILPTVLSRCQLVQVPGLSDEEIEQVLIDRLNLSPGNARSIAQMADGDYNEALSLASQSDHNESELFLDWMRKCYVGNGPELVQWVEGMTELGREKQKQFLRYGLHFLREFKNLTLPGGLDGIKVRLLPNELETARKLTRVIGFEQIESIAGLFDECVYYIERNANQKLLFLDASIQLNKILRR